jgi:tRNA-splicing ligase RtcB
MNYGFAFRLATYASLCEFARQAFGARDSRLVVDSPHNSIYEEDLDGERVILHRHNSCQAYPASRMADHPVFGLTGQAILLPGTNRTSSYLCAAEEGAGASLWSACHGAGTLIDDFAARGLSTPDPAGRTTLRYNYRGSEPELVPQLDDRGVNEALGILRGHRIARPVARLRPIAVLN